MNNNINRDYATENMNLQKEIAELKDKVAYFKEEFEGWQSACEWAEAKNAILKLENQELEEQLKLSNESQETVINTMNLVSQENEKLKKVLEILKEHNLAISYIPDISLPHLTLNDYGDGVTLTQEEYKLLNEVLNDE